MSNQPYATFTTRTIEYGYELGTWKLYSTLPGSAGEVEVFNAVQRCRQLHPAVVVRLMTTTEHRYTAVYAR